MSQSFRKSSSSAWEISLERNPYWYNQTQKEKKPPDEDDQQSSPCHFDTYVSSVSITIRVCHAFSTKDL